MNKKRPVQNKIVSNESNAVNIQVVKAIHHISLLIVVSQQPHYGNDVFGNVYLSAGQR